MSLYRYTSEEYLTKMQRVLGTSKGNAMIDPVVESAMLEINRIYEDFLTKNMVPGDTFMLRLDGWLDMSTAGTTEVALDSSEKVTKFLSELYQLLEARHLGE